MTAGGGSNRRNDRNGGNGWELPRGRHKIPRDLVQGHQRERLLAAAAAALAEQGYSELTVRHVIEGAGVSRATFYEHFEDKLDCVAAAHGWAFEQLSRAIFSACASQREWPDGVAAAIGAALEFAAASPALALLLISHAAVADPRLTQRIVASHDHLVGMLRGGRERCPQPAALQDLTEQALLGAAMAVIGNRLIAGRAEEVPQLRPELVQLVLTPYLGADEARRVALDAQLKPAQVA